MSRHLSRRQSSTRSSGSGKRRANKAAGKKSSAKKNTAKKTSNSSTAKIKTPSAANTGSRASTDSAKRQEKRIAGKQAPKSSSASKKSGKKSGAPTADGYGLKVHVRTARKRTHSSTLWLERQLNDPFVGRAKREGYRSRAAYKFLEMDERYMLLKPGMTIIDLGAAPGSWAQIAARKVKSIDTDAKGAGRVIGIDLLEMEPIAGVELSVMDFTEESAPDDLRAMLRAHGGSDSVHGVLSDMAANTTGHKKTDHLRIVYLAELAAEFAIEVLSTNGFFVAKMFQGGTEGDLLASLKRNFTTVRHVKPKASRADSAELYVLATGFKGRDG